MTKFKQPPSASGPDMKALYNSLLLITPKRVEHDVKTKFGERDAIRADLAVLDGDHKGEEYRDCQIWGQVLQSQLLPLIGTGESQLGRLTQGLAVGGQSPPWVLDEFSEADEKLASEYLASRAGPLGTAGLGEATDDAPPLGDDDEPSF